MLLQINTLLNFKDDKQECPCPEYIREQLLDFHEDLMRHCGTVHAQHLRTCPSQCAYRVTDFFSLSGIELNEERAMDGDSDFTIRGRLISLVEKVAYLKKRMANLPKEKADKKPSKLLIHAYYRIVEVNQQTVVHTIKKGNKRSQDNRSFLREELIVAITMKKSL